MAQQKSRTQQLNGLVSLAYLGVLPCSPNNFIIKQGAPTTNDYRNVNVGDFWLDNSSMYLSPSVPPTSANLWVLVSVVNHVATWINFGSAAAILSLTSNSGGPVFPLAGNINVVGDGTTITGVGNPGTNTITFSVIGGMAANSFPTDSGTAVPAAGVLNIKTDLATNRSGGTVEFTGTGNTVQLILTDVLLNTMIGNNSGNPTNSGGNNTTLGALSGHALTTGGANTLIGRSSGVVMTTGANNSALGIFSLFTATSATSNIAMGYQSLTALTTGNGNSALGVNSLGNLLTGSNNIGLGINAGTNLTGAESNNILINDHGIAGKSSLVIMSLITGISTTLQFMTNFPDGNNTFLGNGAGNLTMTGSTSVGIGTGTLAATTTGGAHTAVGFGALAAATTGNSSCAFGNLSLTDLTTGIENTAIGFHTLTELTSGSHNVALGDECADGLLTGSYNLILGSNGSGGSYTSSESSNILIMNSGVVGESNVMRIGTNGSGNGQVNKSFMAGVAGVTVTNQAPVVINTSTGQLGTSGTFVSVGTWTPTLAFGGASTGITYSAQVGTYSQVGSVVTYVANITLTSKGSATGNATITGLPTAGSSNAFPATLVPFSGITFTVQLGIYSSGTTLNFVNWSTSGTIATLTNTAFTNTSSFLISGTFIVGG